LATIGISGGHPWLVRIEIGLGPQPKQGSLQSQAGEMHIEMK
jgi:hypothetical protein